MLSAIARPFGWMMLTLYDLTHSYLISIILFGILVNLILLPFMMKSKKSMMRTTRLQPRLMAIQRKHEGNPQKLNEETARLYREEGVSPMSGCLWSLLPFPILLALYQAIRMPITIMMGVPKALLAEGGAILNKLTELGFSAGTNSAYIEIAQAKFITEHFDQFSGFSDKLQPISFTSLGLDLTVVPNWKFWQIDFSSAAIWVPAIIIFLLPFASAFISWLSMKISAAMNPAANTTAQVQSTNKMMNLLMPLMSLYIGYIMPTSMCVYWIVNSSAGIIRDVILTKVFTRQMDKEDAVRLAARSEREKEMERKRAETERLRAENATRQNNNTSKKKLQATQKQKDDERRAAAERAERAERRERLGIELPEQPESQVGSRRYAKGRAYVDDRYSNPEGAEEATLAAAEESEFGESIDEYYDGPSEEIAEDDAEAEAFPQDEQ